MIKSLGLLKISLLAVLLWSAPRLSTAQNYILQDAFPGQTFPGQTDGAPVPGFPGRQAIVDHEGKVYIANIGSSSREILIDISDRVFYSGEAGLLAITFAPNFPFDNRFYLYYTYQEPTGEMFSVVSRFATVTSSTLTADPNTEEKILIVPQPYPDHNGGSILFGNDGYLYLSTGDGGGQFDPDRRAQNLDLLNGKVLRIDVNSSTLGRLYGIPQDNPFASATDNRRKEIYAWGLRNPWKMTIDRFSGTIITGDVGQYAIEEIDIIERGANYGWSMFEGTRYTQDDSSRTGLTFPAFEYNQDAGDRSITGGYIYRGNQMPALRGWYIYGDCISGNVWALNLNTKENRFLIHVQGLISSFMLDHNNEIYVMCYAGDEGHNIVRLGVDVSTNLKNSELTTYDTKLYPNPAKDYASLTIRGLQNEKVEVSIFNMAGNKVQSQLVNLTKGQKSKIELNTIELSAGMYLVQISGNGYGKALRLVKE